MIEVKLSEYQEKKYETYELTVVNDNFIGNPRMIPCELNLMNVYLLKVLKAPYCRIHTICELPNIIILNLCGNFLKELPLINDCVEYVDISANYIEKINNKKFHKIKKFYCYGNKLKNEDLPDISNGELVNFL